MDHADYPWDTVPSVVSKIFRSQQWQDQRQRQFRQLYPKEERVGLDHWDFLTPIVADGDMGFGGLTHTMKMTRAFVEAGVAMFHLDDLAIGMYGLGCTSEKRALVTKLTDRKRNKEVYHGRRPNRDPNQRVSLASDGSSHAN